jgi:bifunctional lysine-specific demethylase and histidyl-hydroxylase NO66
MSADDGELAWLLSPLPIDEFLNKVWEQQPYVIKRDAPDYHRSLFSAADLETVLEFGRPQPAELRVISEGEGLPPENYFQSDGRLDLNQLRRLYAEGHTIVIHGLHRLWRPVAVFTQALQRRLSYKVTPNIYLTPRAARGLNSHYDTHDVFIMQIAGVKTWRIYG